MGFDTGFWDRLFGERTTLQVPGPGGLRKVSVTKSWLAQMEREGKMSPVAAPTVFVHVLDPMQGYNTTTWVVGEEISPEEVQRFLDPATDGVYVLCAYEEGRRKAMLLRKDLWDQAKSKWDEIEGS